MRDQSLTEQRKAHLEALHDGELAYTSSQLGRLFAEVDAMPGRTLFVVHTDHGEEFWEHGGFEHNHTLYDEVTRALLAFRPRGGLSSGLRSDVPASLIDLAPTVYDLLGISDPPELDGRSLVPVLKRQPPPELYARGLPVAHVQYRKERWGVVVQNHKYVLYTGSGREELFDLSRDPEERTNLAAGRDLEPYRAHLRHAHRIPVGPGLRLRLDRAPTFTLSWSGAARIAEILDPETLIDHRANVEWGEVPNRLPGDVGEVALAGDGKSLTFTPGPTPSGVIVVLFDDGAEVAPASTTLSLANQTMAWSSGPRGLQIERGESRIALQAGTVLVPPPTEAARMGIGPGAAAPDAEARQLCELGYITDCGDVGGTASRQEPPTKPL
ncbi:MAG: sulfatase/phosphatase domain-containing protein [Myxococcota bacterium]